MISHGTPKILSFLKEWVGVCDYQYVTNGATGLEIADSALRIAEQYADRPVYEKPIVVLIWNLNELASFPDMTKADVYDIWALNNQEPDSY